MAKSDLVALEGTVVDAHPNATFTVELDNGHRVMAHASGKIRQNL